MSSTRKIDAKGLLQELIQADSTQEKGEARAADVIATCFQKRGIDGYVDRWDNNRANVVAHVKTARKRPGLLFVCHLDVVSPGEERWQYPPFEATEAKGRIYGRGAVDMKGGTAAVVAAICDLVDQGTDLQGDIVLAATAGEETDSSGVVRFMQDCLGRRRTEDRGQKTEDRGQEALMPSVIRHPSSVVRHPFSDFAGIVVPEPTDFSVVTAHRGLFWLRITTRGKAVHSSMPERGVNAILAMKRVIDALERYEIPFERHPTLGNSSMSINTITGGEALNIVPDRCTLGVDIRTLPGQDHESLRYDIERILADLKASTPQFDAELVVERSVGAIETDPECEFVKTFCSAVDVDLTNAIHYTTDAPHLLPLGAPIIIYGPGKARLCHEVDEYIDLTDLQSAVGAFTQVIRKFLA